MRVLSSDAGPIECTHCGMRVALTRAICPAYRSAAADRGTRQLVIGGLWLAAAGTLPRIGLGLLVALVALSLGCMHAALGVRQWWQSRRP